MAEKRTAMTPAWLMLAAAVVLFAGALVIFVVDKRHADLSASAKATASETKTVRIPIQGMICTVCAGNVKKALQSLDGVQEAEISLERRDARVRYGEGKVSPERLVAAINQLGYKAGTPVSEASQ